MFRPLSVFIGMRYLRAKKRNHFISFVSLVTILGLMIGSAVLILVLSVMNGFHREIGERILGAIPHLTLEARGPLIEWQRVAAELEQMAEVEVAVPYVQLQGMLTAGDRARPLIAQGIAPLYEKEVSIIDDFMTEGELEDLRPGEFAIVLGDILAAHLRVGVGDQVILVVPYTTTTPIGSLPRLRRFTVTGIYELGSELDANLAFIHLRDAATLARLGDGVEGLRLKLDDVFNAPALSRQLVLSYGESFIVRNWTRSYGNLFASIKLEKRLVGLLLFLIIAVAAFNMVSTLVMLVTDKQNDIAILRTMGASTRAIVSIFVVNGAFAGLIGTTSGVLLGILLSLNIGAIVSSIERMWNVEFLSPDTYFISYLPSQLLVSDIVVVAIATFSLSVLASIYPSWRAAQIQPAEALRYE